MINDDVPFEDSDARCPHCGKLLQVDVGGTFFGEVTAVEFCPSCGPAPGIAAWEREALNNMH